jgi:hypothetical protein
MPTITRETPHFHRLDNSSPADLAKGEGSKLHSTYFEFRLTLPMIVAVAVTELSDSELLVAAEKAGTFKFLNAPEEDGYNDLLKKNE